MTDPAKSDKHVEVTTVVNDASQESPSGSLLNVRHADNALLAQLGYKAEFKREFSVGFDLVLLDLCTLKRTALCSE